MKKKLRRGALKLGAVLILTGTIVFSTHQKTKAQISPCGAYCAFDFNYDCVIGYSDGSSTYCMYYGPKFGGGRDSIN